MEIDPVEEHYTECADDIKSAEFVKEKSDNEYEQLNVEEDAQDIKFINAQDYLDIKESVVSEWNRAAPVVPTALALIEEEHTDPDDAEILAHEEKIRELFLNKIEVRPGTTSLKTQEETNADTKHNVKNDDDSVVGIITGEIGDVSRRSSETEQVVSWRVVLHRLPTDTLPSPTTTTSDIKQEMIDLEEIKAELIMEKKDELLIKDELEEAEIKYFNTQDYLEIGETVVGEPNRAVRDVPTSSGDAVKVDIDASYNDNKSETKQRKNVLEKGTDKFDGATAKYFVLNQPTRAANKAQKKNKINVICETSERSMQIQTGEKRYKCETCDIKCSTSSSLRRHIRTHMNEKPYKCGSCDFKSSRSSSLKKHVRTHMGERPYKCELCGYNYSSSNNLKRHMRIHTGEKPYKCETCDYNCFEPRDLKRHLRIHTLENSYKCETCDFKCTSSKGLKIHMRKHTVEKPYNCETCDYRSFNSCHLKCHMRIHTLEKAYNKSAPHNHLKNYMPIHTGEKPYKCEVCDCDYKCSTSSDLKRHMRTHIGGKPYKCESCDYRSSHLSNLKRHMRTFTGEEPYKCETCDFKCACSSSLKSHMHTHTAKK